MGLCFVPCAESLCQGWRPSWGLQAKPSARSITRWREITTARIRSSSILFWSGAPHFVGKTLRDNRSYLFLRSLEIPMKRLSISLSIFLKLSVSLSSILSFCLAEMSSILCFVSSIRNACVTQYAYVCAERVPVRLERCACSSAQTL